MAAETATLRPLRFPAVTVSPRRSALYFAFILRLLKCAPFRPLNTFPLHSDGDHTFAKITQPEPRADAWPDLLTPPPLLKL